MIRFHFTLLLHCACLDHGAEQRKNLQIIQIFGAQMFRLDLALARHGGERRPEAQPLEDLRLLLFQLDNRLDNAWQMW